MLFQRRRFEPVDTVIDASDAVALDEWSVEQVFASGVTDCYDPVAAERDEIVGNLGSGFKGRSD